MISTKKNKLASLRDPNTLKSGHVKKLSSGKVYVVKRNSEGVARYVKARPDDVKCSKTLKKNVSEMLNEVKKNKNKQSYSQALAIAYSKTQKKYPKCQLVQKTNNKTKKLFKHIQNGGDINKKLRKLQRKIIKLLIEKNYIRKQDNTCNVVNGNNIKSLYNNFKDAPENIRNIKYKKKAYKLHELLNTITNLINNCKTGTSLTINQVEYPFKITKPMHNMHNMNNITIVCTSNMNYQQQPQDKVDAMQYEYMQKLYKFIDKYFTPLN